MKRTSIAKRLLVLAAATLLSPVVAAAGNGEPLELRRIMQALGTQMQVVTDAIARENWAQVAAAAPLIAAHAQPPAEEKARILGFLGKEAGNFRALDEKTHDVAHTLEHAAAHGDGQAVIEAFAKVQASCLACHQKYRKPFVEHFYGGK